MTGPPDGDFPPGTRGQMVMITLSGNNWPLCYAHRYVTEDSTPITGPDPKMIAVDDIVLRQPPKVRGIDDPGAL